MTFTFDNHEKLKNGFPVEDCPYCGEEECEAEWCDVGVGYVQMGPYHCTSCGAFSIGAYDRTTPTDEERKCGWYRPDRRPLPDTVSTIGGRVIDSSTALGLYRMGVVNKVPFHI
jgi:hypothetical protein